MSPESVSREARLATRGGPFGRARWAGSSSSREARLRRSDSQPPRAPASRGGPEASWRSTGRSGAGTGPAGAGSGARGAGSTRRARAATGAGTGPGCAAGAGVSLTRRGWTAGQRRRLFGFFDPQGGVWNRDRLQQPLSVWVSGVPEQVRSRR